MIIADERMYHIDNLSCKQCGACIGVCKKDAIVHSIDPNTGLMRLSINPERCVLCGLCQKFCPATEDFSLQNIHAYSKQRYYYLGYNTDNNIRRKASSGGVTRTIIIEGLKFGFFDAVYSLRKTGSYPFAEGCLYTKENIPTYDDIPNSIYHSVPAAMNLNLIKPCKKLLVVGTTCQISAIRKYAVNKCEQLFTLCIFCKQQKTFESSRFIAKLAGVQLNTIADVSSYAYRGNGWPGYCMFNGKTVSWGVAALMPFGKKLWSVPGCDLCGNPFGEDVDLTVLDPWIINKQNDKGANIVVVHNDHGKLILDSIPQIHKEFLEYEKVEPALMLSDIEKKNKYIPFFRGKDVDSLTKKKGEKFLAQRRYLSSFLTKTSRLPLIVYKILRRVIKDKR